MDNSLLEHLYRFIGQTVTIFTTSGGPSGCGFTGVLFVVNPCYVRLMNAQGTPPTVPLSENICGNRRRDGREDHCRDRHDDNRVGSICDIPIDKIASFCHNAV